MTFRGRSDGLVVESDRKKDSFAAASYVEFRHGANFSHVRYAVLSKIVKRCFDSHIDIIPATLHKLTPFTAVSMSGLYVTGMKVIEIGLFIYF